MEFRVALEVLRPQWLTGEWAKSNGELLWAHQYTVWSVGRKLAAHAPSLTSEETRLLELACLTHDIGKRRSKCQARLRGGQGPGDHKLELEELTAYFRQELSGRIEVSDDEIRAIWDIARTHHSVSGTDIRIQTFARAAMPGKLLMTADWIASMERPDFGTLSRLQEFYEGRIGLTYFEFSRFPSPTSYLAVKIALEQYWRQGWEPLVVFPQGAVLAASPGQPRPSRAELARAIEVEIIQQSLALQKSVPTGYTGDFLTLLSSQYPDQFLTANRSIILEKLGSVDRALVFLKLSRDILSARGRINSAVKEKCVLLDLVDSANSTSAHPRVKVRYAGAYHRPAPDKVNRDMLDPLFEEASVERLIPAGIRVPVDPSTPLRELKDQQLFEILQVLAACPDEPDSESRLCQYLRASLLLEEDADFTALAREIFDRYKRYKQTSDAEKGVCERCASPVTSRMQPALNFATSVQYFSQIKPNKNYRAVCPLCGYDNLVVRKDVRSDSSWIYARIEAKVPDLLTNLIRLQELVARVVVGVRRPRQLLRLQEVPELAGLPFPSRLRIPLSEGDRESPAVTSIPLSERGVLLRLENTKTARGPKDLRGQFEPVYHILNFLGFQVALGTEEQNGLFGQPVPTTAENYLRSLAVILLADVVDKQSNRYVFASELLSRSPSIALSYAAGDGRDRFGLRLELLSEFVKYLVQANVPVTSKKGDVGMKHLLEDAAFLAPSLIGAAPTDEDEDSPLVEGETEEPVERRKKRRGGIWTFCENKVAETGKITKHSASKPISQALDELMLGRGVPTALNKFLQNLRVTIKAEQEEELNTFVAGVQGILKRAEELRKKDITDFLRYKNGLLSAVYMLTRYPSLKSVLANEKE